MILRGKGAWNSYAICRSFGLGRVHSFWRAIRYAATGSTGKYIINWQQKSRSTESVGFNSVEIDRIGPELFAQQIAAAMRYADAPLSHDQFVTLVLYLNARGDGGTDNA